MTRSVLSAVSILPFVSRKNTQKNFYSGKKKKHTIKTQACLHGEERMHDFKLFKEIKIGINPDVKVLADSGYQGIKTKIEKSLLKELSLKMFC